MTVLEKKEYDKQRYLLKRDSILSKQKEYYKNNHEKQKEYRDKNREKKLLYSREYNKNNRDKINFKNNKFRKENPEIVKKWARISNQRNKEVNNIKRKHKYYSDINFKIRHNLGIGIIKAIKNNQKSGKTIQLLGCSIEEFKKYFESKFTEGMTWEKYMNGEIHIDHIIPCCVFDLSKEEAQKICFHYSNIQPLYSIDNFKKNNKVDVELLKKLNDSTKIVLNDKYKKLININN